MHPALLDVLKHLILFRKKGPSEFTYIVCSTVTTKILSKWRETIGLLPSVFVWNLRGFDGMRRWKATELQQLPLYSGCIALKDILTQECYKTLSDAKSCYKNFFR